MQPSVIEQKIFEIRGQKVVLDFDLARLYEVEARVLNQAVKRNINRFPIDFMFQLTEEEFKNSSQFVMSSPKNRGLRYLLYAFTEQGVSMLSSVLRSDNAINVNIAIMRAFVFMRQYALSHKDLTDKLKELESKYDKQFGDVYEALNFLLKKDKQQEEHSERKRIGFIQQNKTE